MSDLLNELLNSPDLSNIRRRHSELKTIIASADAVREEFRRLELAMAMLERAEQILSGGPLPLNVTPFGRRGNNSDSGLDTVDVIESVLGAEAVHLKDIQSRMYEAGWGGSGDRHKDYKNLHQSLRSKPKRFKRVDRAIYAVVGAA
jgi:hypothetical protein